MSDPSSPPLTPAELRQRCAEIGHVVMWDGPDGSTIVEDPTSRRDLMRVECDGHAFLILGQCRCPLWAAPDTKETWESWLRRGDPGPNAVDAHWSRPPTVGEIMRRLWMVGGET